MFKKIPNYIKYICINFLLLFAFNIIFRVIFYQFFAALENATASEVQKAFLLGFRFDIKLAAIAIFPLAFLILIVNKKFFLYKFYKTFSSVYLIVVYLTLALFYAIDFGYYDYLSIRLDAASLRFLEDLKISSQMLLESYPVFKGLLGFLLLAFLVFKASKYLYTGCKSEQVQISKKKKALYFIATFLLLSFSIYNSFNHYPLRWSEAFFSKNNKVNQFALNPVIYFFDSFAFRSEAVNMTEFKKYYPVIAKDLNLPKDSISFERKVVFKDAIKSTPNVIFVMLESVGVKPLSYYGNPINSSPNMDNLIASSLSFSNFYVHKSGTAASVFASVTGLPDIDDVNTASRNPMVIDQRILFDQFKGYEKLYFLGGSANWANIRGIFQSNIKGLKIFEEGSYETENRADVWGIDDYELFKESDKELQKLHQQNKPFVAYIQTASNHMPFTVPDKKEQFTPISETAISESLIKESGFKSVAQLNALRYLDFNIGRFLERAKSAGYYKNTVFVFFGDHNTAMNRNDQYTNEYDLNIQLQHVPVIIHAPEIVEPKEITTNGKLIDLFPTVMSLLKMNHTNYTLGRNLLDSIKNKNPSSFVYLKINGEPAVGLIQDSLYYSKTNMTKTKALYNLKSKNLIDLKEIYPKKALEMDSLLSAYYHATKYLYFNNKKSNE
ncbi:MULTISPECIES: LTA synthase family protein [unclassified Polaribacter]|uniref:LTA synthase family protein n=1 Tax=unclassified Polaribacter TaxID=196858 RepID=UPI0011BDBDC6|nr:MULTISPECIES: alkaline phosphatase family protein [unclassified Polaribacter]TXD49603.1 sulfatase-like hydrolase/transferase [Polaribacter sp. IC063]TXD59077.1 sulfatase-like hydrolase/transferase [Polaribacter sp. IC066]